MECYCSMGDADENDPVKRKAMVMHGCGGNTQEQSDQEDEAGWKLEREQRA